jgi:DNA ligase (NAD+)
VAYKFQGDTGTTTLEDVAWSVSRSGTITPVARVAPVELSGAFISRVSLHHLTRFRQLGLRAGARVEVTRRGGVIPQLERVTEAGEGAPFEPPSTCPACGAAVEVRSKREGEFLTCTNAGRCSRARERALEHFAKVIDLQGFGPKVVRQLVDAGLLGTPADFYRLRADDLAQLDRLGAKAAANLVGQVEAHRVVELATFLEALGIEHLGRRNAELLAREFGSLEAIRAADATTFEGLHGVKQAIAAAWVEGLASHAGLVDDLLREVELRTPVKQVAGTTAAGPFAGTSFVFTGTLEGLDRRTAQAEVLSRGGTTPDTVGRDLTYLVVGAGRGAKSTKQKKAEQLVAAGSPLRILAESEFLDMLAATGWTAPNVGS